MNRKKKLLILGAGIYQVPLIRKAHELNLETYVCSIPGNYPGISLADHFFPLDTRDTNAVCDLAEQICIDGVCTSGTDVAVKTIGYICDRLNLNGISHSSARLVTDKLLMKQAFRKAGVHSADFRKICSEEDAYSAASELGYPLIIKPADSSGSRGVKKVSDTSDLISACKEAFRLSRLPYILAEAFIDAKEIGVDAFIEEGQIKAFLPHDKLTLSTPDGSTIPAGHIFPFRTNQRLAQKLFEQISLAAHSLNMDQCALNADVFIKGENIWIIEIGARSGATCIPELISLNQGYNWYEQLIRSALGEPTDFHSEMNRPCGARLLFSPITDTIIKIDETLLSTLPQDVTYQIDIPVGGRISAVHDGTDRLGHVIAPTDDRSLLDTYAQMILRSIWVSRGNLGELLAI